MLINISNITVTMRWAGSAWVLEPKASVDMGDKNLEERMIAKYQGKIVRASVVVVPPDETVVPENIVIKARKTKKKR